MHNYLNTSSSFGFTSESSNSPDHKLNLPEQVALRFHRGNNHDHHQRAQIQDESDVQLQDDDYSKLFQQSEQGNQNSTNEQIYLAIFSIKIKNTFRLLYRLLNNRVMYHKQLAFIRIRQTTEHQIQVKVNTLNYNTNDFASLSRALKNIASKSNYLKQDVLQNLIEHMKQSRSSQLKMLYILGRGAQCRQKQAHSLIKYAFSKLKYSNQHTNAVQNSLKTNRSKNFNRARRIIACKLIVATLCKKYYNNFRHFKFCGSILILDRVKKADVYGNKSRNSTHRVSTGNLNSQSGYLNQAAARKMIKQSNKAIELKVESNLSQQFKWACLYRIIKQLIQKQYNFGINKIISSFSKNKNHDQSQNEGSTQEDDPTVISNILRHMCWLSLEQSKMLTAGGNRQYDEIRNKYKKLFVLKLKMQHRESVRQGFSTWRNNAIAYRLGIMERVKQLEELKESLIQNYK